VVLANATARWMLAKHVLELCVVYDPWIVLTWLPCCPAAAVMQPTPSWPQLAGGAPAALAAALGVPHVSATSSAPAHADQHTNVSVHAGLCRESCGFGQSLRTCLSSMRLRLLVYCLALLMVVCTSPCLLIHHTWLLLLLHTGSFPIDFPRSAPVGPAFRHPCCPGGLRGGRSAGRAGTEPCSPAQPGRVWPLGITSGG
jgi:hypothetical protein